MFQIDDSTAAGTLPTPEAAGTPAYFTEGTPGVTPATQVKASWLNMIQQELINIVTAAAITPSKTIYNQVLLALKALFGQLAAVNIWTAAQQGAFVSAAPVGSGATLTLNFALGNNFVVNGVTANFVLGTPSGLAVGQTGLITFVQDGTGGHTISSRSTAWVGASGARVQLTAGASGRDTFFYWVDFDSKIGLSAANNVS